MLAALTIATSLIFTPINVTTPTDSCHHSTEEYSYYDSVIDVPNTTGITFRVKTDTDGEVTDPSKSDPYVVDDTEDIVRLVPLLIDAAKTGQWVLFTVILLQVLIFVLKKVKFPFMKTHGAAVVVILSGVAAALTKVLGGVDWITAATVFVVNSLTPVVYDYLKQSGVLPSGDTDTNE